MEFQDYYSRENILKYLCKIRISYAKKRHKRRLLNDLVHKEIHLKKPLDAYDSEILSQLDMLLPRRRQWLTHNCRRHVKCKNVKTGKDDLKKLDADVKNMQILYTTVKRHSKNKSKYPYQEKLDEFILKIQNGIVNCNLKIETPNIVPEVKETNKSKKKYDISKNNQFECRPISRFNLIDRIVISITNKFLTDLLDHHFEDSSLAFRAKLKDSSEDKNHHLAVNRIIEFKRNNFSTNLYVAECDIKKFYDTVNHELCYKLFEDLLEKEKDVCSENSLNSAKYIFKEYLNCYNFEDVVLSKGKSFWEQQFHPNNRRINGIFPWVGREKAQNEYYRHNPNQKIGVPQGGALSGLIANIMLDQADKAVRSVPDLFYVRYCDDMILMHKDLGSCKRAIELYQSTLRELLLFSHPFETVLHTENENYATKKRLIPLFVIDNLGGIRILKVVNFKFDKLVKRYFPNCGVRERGGYNLTFRHSLKKFWNCKSKGPYQWGKLDIEKGVYPWLGFVGYEIDYNCYTRVRKRSIKKEIEKQKRVITSILFKISKKEFMYKRRRNSTIYRSAFEKLNGMSVGRVAPYNYRTCGNKMCWTDGFRSLNFNKYSKKQLKKLDRHKYKYLHILRHKMGMESVVRLKPEYDSRDIYKLGKMFSYFFHAGEKKTDLSD